jgi:predicted nucleic acid-binding protein
MKLLKTCEERVITAIDTNVLIDIFASDPIFGKSSAQAVRACLQAGSVHACEIVFIETASAFPKYDVFLDAMQTLGIEFSTIQKDTLPVAAKAWHKYRKTGGKRDRVVADFLIGSHALAQSDRLLTRDRGFYRHYFHSLTVIDPSKP